MTSTIGLYRANITPLDRLINTTVGRKEELQDIIEKLHRNSGKKGGQHYLFIGPRGIGKTHFMTLLEDSIKKDEQLNQEYTIIRFPEETNRILSFADFLLGTVFILAEAKEEQEWRELHHSLKENEKDQEVIDTIEFRLKQYQKQTGKTLLIIMENLYTLFTEQIKSGQDIHRFRSFLMDSPCATLVGTSPVYFPGLYSSNSPLYDFFDIQVFEDLTEDQTLELIRKQLEWDKKDDLLNQFDACIPKIKTIHTMTGGNPRLIVILYELMAYDNILDVKAQFQKLLDQISPFYQDRLKELAPQERALLETMALMRTEPRTPVNIARNLRKPPQQVSSLLKRMTDAGYLTITDNPKGTNTENSRDKRSRFYRIKEGFFDLWLAMGESRSHRQKLSYLIELFEGFYTTESEREKKRADLWILLEQEPDKLEKKKNYLEMLDYLSELGDEKEQFQTKLELAVHKLKEADAVEAKRILEEVKPLAAGSEMFQWISEKATSWSEVKMEFDVLKWLDDMIQYWRLHRLGDLEKAAAVAQKLGTDLSGRGLHMIRLELLKEVLENENNLSRRFSLYHEIATSQFMDGKLDGARESLENALSISKKLRDRSGEGATLNNISQIYYALGDYEKSLNYLEQSLKIRQEIGDRRGEGTTLNNIGLIYEARGDYQKALSYLEQSLKISQEIGYRRGEGATLNNISQIYYALGDYERVLGYLEQSIRIRQEIGDRRGEGTTLNNIAGIYRAWGDYEKALNSLEQSLKISQEIGDRRGEGTALNDIAGIYQARGDYERALSYLEQSHKIRHEIGDRTGLIATLHNMAMVSIEKKNIEHYYKLEREAFKHALETKDAMGVYNVGKMLGRMICREDNRQEGIRILSMCLQIGKQANYPDVKEIEEFIQSLDEK